MQDVDSSCPLVAAGSCNPSLRWGVISDTGGFICLQVQAGMVSVPGCLEEMLFGLLPSLIMGFSEMEQEKGC